MSMPFSLSMPDELLESVRQVAEKTHLSQQDVVRQSLKLGLPTLEAELSVARPEGYFADDYPEPEEREKLKLAMAKVSHKERD